MIISDVPRKGDGNVRDQLAELYRSLAILRDEVAYMADLVTELLSKKEANNSGTGK